MESDGAFGVLLAFAALLFVAVLLSDLAQRSILSAAALFLVAGFVLGEGGLSLVGYDVESTFTERLIEVALFTVLFVDGMEVDLHAPRRSWALPARALIIGLPLTFALLVVVARLLLHTEWTTAVLIAIALSPTDPVFASAIVSRDEVPKRLRRLLNLESGLNDGLVLPALVITLSYLQQESLHVALALAEVVLGIAVGVGIPWAAIRIERMRFFRVARSYELTYAIAVALLVFAIAQWTHANEFLAAFTAGVVFAAESAIARQQELRRLGELASELLKLLVVLLFGLVVSPEFIREETAWRELLFVAIALIVVRPLALTLALLGSELRRGPLLAAAWFGPRGLASMLFGLLVLNSAVLGAAYVFHVVAMVAAVSILVHSSTDHLVAKWLSRTPGSGESEPENS